MDRAAGPGGATGEAYAVVLLDAGPLGLLTHPRRAQREEPFRWLVGLRRANVRVAAPEIADYDLRRELIRAGKTDSVGRLDALEDELVYLPLTTKVMLRAAELWADARNRGKPTAPDPALDGDVILAAQALVLEEELGEGVFVATTNPEHISRYVAAGDWRDVGPSIGDAAEDDKP